MSELALQVPDHILDQAKAAATEEQISIDQLLVSLIAEGLGHRRALRPLRQRRARADIAAAAHILDGAPDVPPDGGDELPNAARENG